MTMSSRTSETISQKQRDGSKDRFGEVWEIWDAVSKKRIFVAKGLSDVLEEKDDPYSNWINSSPAHGQRYATLTNEDLFPIPDYLQYIDLAEELDTISWRIRKLTQALSLKGIYDASAPGLGRLLESGMDGKMIAVDNMVAIIGKSTQAGGGLNGVVQWLPDGACDYQTLTRTLSSQGTGQGHPLRGLGNQRYRPGPGRSSREGSAVQDQGELCVTAPGAAQDGPLRETARDVSRIQVEIMTELYSPMTIREQSGIRFHERDGRRG